MILRPPMTVLAAALVLLAAAPAAHAVTCYVVMDRNDNVIYRDVVPPVDLSDAGIREREALRMRGEYFLFHEADTCPRVEFFTGAAGSVGLRLDQTLSPTTAPPASAPAVPPASAPVAPARSRR
ncbi:MAG: hypothetical protein KJ018_01645 [Burkholderiales bacterium]|nr:hypothetical protein [Burkholderiales bacterium]